MFAKEELDELHDFAKQFLEADWCEAHNVGVGFSRLRFLNVHYVLNEVPSEPSRNILSPAFKEIHGSIQAVVFYTVPHGDDDIHL